jgi:hypothetical protein
MLFGGLVLLGLSSCKKDYQCSCDLGALGTVVNDYNDLTKDEAKSLQTECESTSLCTWSTQ